MFQTSGYYKGLTCPYFSNGLCERPYCHFRHVKSTQDGKSGSHWNTGIGTLPNPTGSNSLLAKVGESIQKLQRDIERDQQLLNGHRNAKTSGIERFAAGTVEKYISATRVTLGDAEAHENSRKLSESTSTLSYKPTPIAELKRQKDIRFNPVKRSSQDGDDVAAKHDHFAEGDATVLYKPTPKKKARLGDCSNSVDDEIPVGKFSDDDGSDVEAKTGAKIISKPLKLSRVKRGNVVGAAKVDPNDLVSQIMQDSSESLALRGVEHRSDGSMMIFKDKKRDEVAYTDQKKEVPAENTVVRVSPGITDRDAADVSSITTKSELSSSSSSQAADLVPNTGVEHFKLAMERKGVWEKINSGAIVLGPLPFKDGSNCKQDKIGGSRDAPSSGSRDAPSSGSRDAPSSGSRGAPSSGSRDAPSSGSQDAPSSGSRDAPSSGCRDAPSSGHREGPSSDGHNTMSNLDNSDTKSSRHKSKHRSSRSTSSVHNNHNSSSKHSSSFSKSKNNSSSTNHHSHHELKPNPSKHSSSHCKSMSSSSKHSSSHRKSKESSSSKHSTSHRKAKESLTSKHISSLSSVKENSSFNQQQPNHDHKDISSSSSGLISGDELESSQGFKLFGCDTEKMESSSFHYSKLNRACEKTEGHLRGDKSERNECNMTQIKEQIDQVGLCEKVSTIHCRNTLQVNPVSSEREASIASREKRPHSSKPVTSPVVPLERSRSSDKDSKHPPMLDDCFPSTEISSSPLSAKKLSRSQSNTVRQSSKESTSAGKTSSRRHSESDRSSSHSSRRKVSTEHRENSSHGQNTRDRSGHGQNSRDRSGHGQNSRDRSGHGQNSRDRSIHDQNTRDRSVGHGQNTRDRSGHGQNKRDHSATSDSHHDDGSARQINPIGSEMSNITKKRTALENDDYSLHGDLESSYLDVFTLNDKDKKLTSHENQKLSRSRHSFQTEKSGKQNKVRSHDHFDRKARDATSRSHSGSSPGRRHDNDRNRCFIEVNLKQKETSKSRIKKSKLERPKSSSRSSAHAEGVDTFRVKTNAAKSDDVNAEPNAAIVLDNLFGDDSDSDSIVMVSSVESSPSDAATSQQPRTKSLSVGNLHRKSTSKSSRNDSDDITDGIDWNSDPFGECLEIFNESTTTVDAKILPWKSEIDSDRHAASKRIARTAFSSNLAARRPPVKTEKKFLSPAEQMHHRFKLVQQRRGAAPAASQGLQPFNTSEGPGTSSKTRIAHKPVTKPTDETTPVQSSKCLHSFTREEHVPSAKVLQRPIIPCEFGTRVPVNIRQRYLNQLIDECLSIYKDQEAAFERALNEEKVIYDRSTSRIVYLNVAVNAIRQIRAEVAQTSGETSSGGVGAHKTWSHEAVLGGSKAAKTSYTLHRSGHGNIKGADEIQLTSVLFSQYLEQYVLTEEQMKDNGFPMSDPTDTTLAKFYAAHDSPVTCLKLHEKVCCRCGKRFRVYPDGTYASREECLYHWGRSFKRKISGSWDNRYTCCSGDLNAEPCCTAKLHVHDSNRSVDLSGYVRTYPRPPSVSGYGIYALDCEMVYTVLGSELARVTVIDMNLDVVYETLVKPGGEIVDYNSRFSGLEEGCLKKVKTTLKDVQAKLRKLFSERTLLIGHSLESDFTAMKLLHSTVVDTSVVFPHRLGPPYKRALRTIMGEVLKKIIQNDEGGHDSREDAAACMELMIWKVKEEIRVQPN